ncbi:tetratricopeptide repeat protein [Candidatus Poribacteria bacterium]
MTVKEAAQNLGKSTTTIRRWIKEGKLDAVMVDGRYDVHNTHTQPLDCEILVNSERNIEKSTLSPRMELQDRNDSLRGEREFIELECLLSQNVELSRRMANQKAEMDSQKRVIQELESQLKTNEKGAEETDIPLVSRSKTRHWLYARRTLRPTALAVVLIALITYGFIWADFSSSLGNGLELARSVVLYDDEADQEDQRPLVVEPEAYASSLTTPSQVLEAYDQAIADCMSRKYDLAIRAFQQILEYPSSHNLKDNAQYWLAECYSAKCEYDQALIEFQKVKENFPESNKLFDSELMVAYTYYRSGRIKQAKQKLAQLSGEFPDEIYQSRITALSEKIRLMKHQRAVRGEVDISS